MKNIAPVLIIYLQADLNLTQVQPLRDQSGQIKKNDFIDYCIEVKLLDLADKKKERNPSKKEKKELDMKKDNKKEVTRLPGAVPQPLY